MPRSASRPRVFVSSVVEGFSPFREAARRGIEAAGGEPVLVNEDFPSLAASSRNACLDAIDSCDYLLSIVGERGGWTTPSGKLVVEEEYEHARARKLTTLAFLQNVARDSEATRFVRTLSDYVDGAFRRTFSTPDELQREVERALRPLLAETPTTKKMRRKPRDYFATPYSIPQTTTLRFALSPEREEEVIDPVRLGSDGLRERVFEIAHSPSVRLFSYERPKTPKVEGDSLVITQTEAGGRHGEGEFARLQISEAGEIIIDANVTGRVQRGSRFSMLDSMVVALEDVESVLRTCFAFSAAFYDDIDRYKRHQRFGYNVGLSGLDYRMLVRNAQQRPSQNMSMRARGNVIAAFDELRLIGRGDLAAPAGELERVVTLLTRRAGD